MLCRLFTIIFFSALISCSLENELYCQPERGRPLQILCLGHKPRRQHDLKVLGQALFKALARKGIFFTYTEDLNDLNLETLNKYDALLLYGNHRKISKTQEEALIRYVESGHGFIPVHCACWCFHDSEKFTRGHAHAGCPHNHF